MEAVARYRRKNQNPFEGRSAPMDVMRVTSEFKRRVSQEKLEKLARQAAPRGYELIEVFYTIDRAGSC